MSAYETLLVEERGSTIRVTINRPKALNALNQQVVAELGDVVRSAPASTRALVLEGSGDKAFVAGADISEMKGLATSEALRFARQGQALTEYLEAAPYITIAKVQGFALGGGCELALACDVIVAAHEATFGQPEVDLGLIAGFGGTQRLIRRVGLALALDVLCCGRKLKGDEAARCGLASRAVPLSDLETEVGRILKSLERAAPEAVSETKRLARAAWDMPLSLGLAAEASAFAARFGGAEAFEGLSAFLEKRKASFSL